MSSSAVHWGGITLFILGPLLLLVVAAATAFWIWALVDCARKEPAGYSGKVPWLVVIALLHWIGAMAYCLIRRPRRLAKEGT